MLVVSYLSDYTREYVIGLAAIRTLERLGEYSLHWASVAYDAWDVVRRMDEASYLIFAKGQKKETRGGFAGAAWAAQYGAIMLPELLLHVSVIATLYGAPWGTAFLQCERAGLIVRKGDVYSWIDPANVKEVGT